MVQVLIFMIYFFVWYFIFIDGDLEQFDLGSFLRKFIFFFIFGIFCYIWFLFRVIRQSFRLSIFNFFEFVGYCFIRIQNSLLGKMIYSLIVFFKILVVVVLVVILYVLLELFFKCWRFQRVLGLLESRDVFLGVQECENFFQCFLMFDFSQVCLLIYYDRISK